MREQMKKFYETKQKGITLIALIITIIVMLILVAVTITVAMQGRLFETAREVSEDTKEAMVEEQIQSAMIVSYNPTSGGIDKDKLVGELEKIEDINEIGEYERSVIAKYYRMSKEINVETSVIDRADDELIGKLRLYTRNDIYFILDNEGENIFARNVDLYVGEQDESTGLANMDTLEKFSSNSKSGYLFNKDGYCVCGWIGDNISNVSFLSINAAEENNGAKRKGTSINEDGKIYATYEDNSSILLGQIPILEINPEIIKMSYSNGLYKIASGGEFTGIGSTIESIGRILIDETGRMHIVKKQKDTAYLVFGDNTNRYYGREVELYTGNLTASGKLENLNRYDKSNKSGYLGNVDGYVLKGWIADENGQIVKDNIVSININAPENNNGALRKGTKIDADGKVYATYDDNSKILLAQLPIIGLFDTNSIGNGLYEKNQSLALPDEYFEAFDSSTEAAYVAPVQVVY